MKTFRLNNTGISLIEIVIAAGLLLLVGAALVQLGISSLRTADSSRTRAIALQLADESLEISRYIRDNDPNTFFTLSGNYSINTTTDAFTSSNCNPTSTPFSPPASNSCEVSMSLSGAPITFWRVVNIRNTTGLTNAKDVTAYVFWNNEGTYSNVSTSTILTRWKN
ncbi:hypothetical protein HGA91_04310 [candidate division WWE3 bacterium]|nr:hypothetical protein [candidate division WWE3 bacterium]